jgi:predicted aspartyl protease
MVQPLARWRACLGSIVLASVVLPAGAADDSSLHVRLVQNHCLIVPVWIGDHGPFDFMLDTGTNVTMLAPELAVRLGVRPSARVTLQTVAGSRVVPYARLPRVSLGPRVLEDVEAVLAPPPDLPARGAAVQGVLGQNALSRLNFRIDYRTARLTFERPGEPPHPPGHRIRTESHDGRLMVSATVFPAARTLRLVVDSGVPRLLVRDGLLLTADVPAPREASGDVLAGTSLGAIALRLSTVRQLTIGRLMLSNVPAAILAGSTPLASGAADGLLPTSLFDWIFFDNREGSIVVHASTGSKPETLHLQPRC